MKMFCQLFFDINNLKKINDTYGHNKGDLAIIDIVEIASKDIRQSDVLVRMGGDEFVIILPNCNYQDADSIMKRFQENLFRINNDKRMYKNKNQYKLDHLLDSIK